MNKLMTIIAGAVVVLGTVVALGATANAEVNGANCEVTTRHYIVGEDTITAKFLVKQTGAQACTKDVTVAAWNAPNGTNGVPLSAQTLHDSVTGTFEPGFGELTVKKPKCFYQVDLLRGTNPIGENTGGGANYLETQFVSSTHGGEKCVEPKTPEQPKEKPQPKGTGGPAELPNTGAGDVAMIAMGVGGAAGVAHNIRSRRNRR